MSRSLCNCHWSRQMSNMRHFWNKIFFVIIRVMVVINQIIIMSPFIYYKNSKQTNFSNIQESRKSNFPVKPIVKWKFRTHRYVTITALCLLVFYIFTSPFMVKLASAIYTNTRKSQDNLFTIIAKFTMASDVGCSLIIMAYHVWKRERIVRVLNLFNLLVMRFKQLDKDFVDLKILIALLLKMSLTIYEIVLSLPFLVSMSRKLSTQSIVAFAFTHYLQMLSYVFALNLFMGILILFTCSLQLEKELQLNSIVSNDLKMSQLIRLQNALHELIALFVDTFQFGIFLIILLYFVTILCNIYAMLDYFVTTGRLFRTFIAYLVSIAVEMYSLILVTYYLERSQRKVKDLFLQREELYFLKVSKPLSIVDTDLFWPQLNEFPLLGLFNLNNEFALFLLAYSINFIVIILEFEVNKAHK